MCMRPFKIRPVNKNAPNVVYVPCGTCKDCRNAYKSQWQIRLTTELIEKQKLDWYVGFCTLTYDDVHLPRVPKDLLFDLSKRHKSPLHLQKTQHFTTWQLKP